MDADAAQQSQRGRGCRSFLDRGKQHFFGWRGLPRPVEQARVVDAWITAIFAGPAPELHRPLEMLFGAL
jgi:hypothetical protein